MAQILTWGGVQINWSCSYIRRLLLVSCICALCMTNNWWVWLCCSLWFTFLRTLSRLLKKEGLLFWKLGHFLSLDAQIYPDNHRTGYIRIIMCWYAETLSYPVQMVFGNEETDVTKEGFSNFEQQEQSASCHNMCHLEDNSKQLPRSC